MSGCRRGDDTARADNADKGRFLEIQARSPGREHHCDRPDHKDEDPDKCQVPAVERQQIGRSKIGREHDKDAGYEDRGDAFLETTHLFNRGEARIGDDKTEQGDSDQTGFIGQRFSRGKADQNSCQDERRLHRLGHPPPPEGTRKARPESEAERSADQCTESERHAGLDPVLT